MKNRLFKIALLLLVITSIIFIYINQFDCVIKSIIHISCPMCGFTRAINSMLKLDFLSAINYNILAIPAIILIIMYGFVTIIDIIKNTKYLEKYLNKLGKHYLLIVILFVISMIINNIKGI